MEAAARREARRQKILSQAENRLSRILSGPDGGICRRLIAVNMEFRREACCASTRGRSAAAHPPRRKRRVQWTVSFESNAPRAI